MIDARTHADKALHMASIASTPDMILHWLSVAEAWEARIPAEAESLSGFADIGAGADETHRIVLCISPTNTAAIFDPRHAPPVGAIFATTAKAIAYALELLDGALAEA
jgi:hypothetical protein